MNSEGLYQLVKDAKTSKKAMSEAVLRFEPLTHKYARHLANDPEDQRDAEQEIRMEIIQAIRRCAIENFPENATPPLVSYICKSAKNRYIQLWKKKCAHPEAVLLDQEHWPDIADSEDQKISVEMKDLLRCLPEKQRQILVGYYYCGYSDQEMANTFQITRQAVCKDRKKALKLLKDAM